MTATVKHTKKQVNEYDKAIQSSIIDPLQKQIIENLSAVENNKQEYEYAINSAFEDPNYQAHVKDQTVLLANTQVDLLNTYNQKKVQTQFEQLFSIDVSDILDERVTKDVMDSAIDWNIDLIKSIPTELHEQVQIAYTDIITNTGFDQQAVANMLTDRFGVSRSRSKFIASDQTAKTMGALNHTRQQQAGATHFIWRTSDDERVRPAHAELDNQIFSYDSPPSIGMPSQPIRCRCIAEPVILGVTEINQNNLL